MDQKPPRAASTAQPYGMEFYHQDEQSTTSVDLIMDTFSKKRIKDVSGTTARHSQALDLSETL
jgi:hypothetical protein